MPSICGVLSSSGSLPTDGPTYFQEMLDALKHRGSDVGTVELCAHVTLACTSGCSNRTSATRQPSGGDLPVVVVCDGQIDNADALRDELRGRGREPRTDGVADMIACLYLELGDECVSRLRGVFSLAVWDEKNRRLILARDRLGQKPLFYSEVPGGLVFASTPQAPAVAPEVSRDIDIEALDDYLRFGYVPRPRTIFEGVKKLPPAHMLVAENGRIRLKRYWEMRFDEVADVSEDEAVEELLESLRRTTRWRVDDLDRPAVLLSGGVDSSLVTGLASEIASQPVRTYSIGFQEAKFDERPHAKRVAERYGTAHQEHIIVGAEIAETFPKLVWHYGEPYSDASAVATFEVCRFARQDVPVVLLGDGGDDLFAGYDQYAFCLGQLPVGRHPLLRVPLAMTRLARPVVAPLARLTAAALAPLSSRSQTLHALRDSVDYMSKTFVERHQRHTAILRDEKERIALLSPDLREALASRDPWPEYLEKSSIGDPTVAPLNQLISADLATYLPDDLCVKTEVAGAGNDIGLRAPILDDDIIEFALRLRPDLKVKNGVAKHILRRVARQFVPAENLDRRKQGFAVPVGAWLRGPLKDMCCDTMLDSESAKRGLLDGKAVSRMVRQHVDAVLDHYERLWQLFMLELWLRECADGRGPG